MEDLGRKKEANQANGANRIRLAGGDGSAWDSGGIGKWDRCRGREAAGDEAFHGGQFRDFGGEVVGLQSLESLRGLLFTIGDG
jgi:hypothetical protein